MTLTELARLAELEDLLTVGLVEQPINGSVLSWGEAALIAHRIGRHLLRATPVADTAGIDAAWKEAEADPAFVTALNEGLADVAAGRVSSWADVRARLAAATSSPAPPEGLREATDYAAQIAHHHSWDSDNQRGHTEIEWRQCREWPCSALASPAPDPGAGPACTCPYTGGLAGNRGKSASCLVHGEQVRAEVAAALAPAAEPPETT